MRSTSVLSQPEKETCRWRTGDRRCRLQPTAVGRCAWHHHWARLVDSGAVGRGQEEEFREWWEQFQPWGVYGDRPGPWWADVEMLWSALCGFGDAPVLTVRHENELLLRRCEVFNYRQGRVAYSPHPWPRLNEAPLPQWNVDYWSKKIAGPSAA